MTTVTTPPDTAAVVLFAELQSRGLFLELRGSDLLRVGPPDLLNDDLLERVRAAKTAILSLLRDQGTRTWSCVRCGKFAFNVPTVCAWCRHAAGREHHA